ncbi:MULTISPECIES: hypothetical protein [Vibrio]|uniref:Uncharacterized protein n=1 Tax=Vibrio jasicida TaxID=766224 RepID=A0AAU9QR46_9VIBR|nr:MULTISPECIES: hypothetical protein [Vibrio]KIP70539.1 hypothetical protein SN10_16440 [Vibrio harveyi]KIP78819.1 hypothetical protein SN11_05525 [Vibrio harveyi]MCF6451900.1 hypothetical protein [Vibrio sp. MMG023]PAW10688.1 hypothetical protein B6K85_11395 [Vibrio sp. V1B]PQJ63080.1 hypothetical protein BTO01_15655 [Vibrio jasicida]
MKLVTGLLIAIAALMPLTSLANGASGGRTLAPEIKCELPNGNVHMLPPLYCKMYDGKKVK